MAVRATIGYYKAKAIIKHGSDFYDYSKWPDEWVPSYAKVTIGCPVHGEFEQQISVHARGDGCPECANSNLKARNKKGVEFYLDKATKTHAGKYDYSLVPDNASSLSIVRIVCPNHGVFEQRLERHASGAGCRDCGYLKTYTGRDKRIDRCNEVHDGKYDYSLVPPRISAKSKVEIICPDHGKFTQQISNHENGQGCPSCGTGGFNRNKAGFIYILRSSCGEHMKVGITNNTSRRVSEIKRVTPFELDIILEKKFENGEHVVQLEKLIHSFCTSSGFTGFNGATEWFHYDQNIYDTLYTL